MSARSTRARKRAEPGVAMVTTHADIHVADDVEEGTQSPATTPRQSPRRTPPPAPKGNASKKKKPSPKPKVKRITVSDLSETVYAMQESAERQEGRVERVEGRMDGMDAKLDFIVSALGKDKSNTKSANDIHVSHTEEVTPPRRQTQSRSAASTGHSIEHGDRVAAPAAPVLAPLCPLPAPATLVAEQNKEGALDLLMSRQNFKPSANAGKRVSYGESGMPKPYMFLEREGLQTNRQRLDLRCAMTSDEYIYCVLALLHEKDSCQHEDRDDILAHLFAVVTDILNRPWPAVRRWTQYVWDSVERGRCKWSDYRFIQDARVRLSYMTGPAPVGGGSSIGVRGGASATGNECKSVVCPDYNAPQGCMFSSSHDDGNIRYTHACAHCNALGRRSAHSFQRCRTRLDAQMGGGSYPQNQSTSDSRQWNHQPSRTPAGQGSAHHYNNSRHGQGHAKNGY